MYGVQYFQVERATEVMTFIHALIGGLVVEHCSKTYDCRVGVVVRLQMKDWTTPGRTPVPVVNKTNTVDSVDREWAAAAPSSHQTL